MARLPDRDDLGARPIPQSRRSIASNPRAGAVGDAVASLGETVGGIAKQQFEREDRLTYAAAKSAVLRADVQARQELQTDPDYETWGQRYTAKMTAAREAAGKLITSNSDRALFESDAMLDVERGAAELGKVVTARRVSSRNALLTDGLDNLQDVGRNAMDEPTRIATIGSAHELINAAVASGDVDAVRGAEMRQQWASNYLSEQITAKMLLDDPDGANAILTANADKLDWQTRLKLGDQIKGAIDTRMAVSDVAGVLGAEVGTNTTVQYGDPLHGKGTGVSSDFAAHQGRGSNGVDFTGRVGTPIYAIGAGKVVGVGHDSRSGNFVRVDHGNGRISSYSHMNGHKVKVGDEIGPDTELGGIGMTGKTTGPHVHVVVRENGTVVDPQKVIGRAAQSPRKHDLNEVYGLIDARADREGWSFERRERAKGEADRQVRRDELLLSREQDTAYEAALTKAETLGDNFTDVSQLGDAFYNASPQQRETLRNKAEANAKPKEVKASGATVLTLELMAINDPETFAKTDLRGYSHLMTPAEFASLAKDQAKIKTEGPKGNTAVSRSDIASTINFYARDIGLKVGADSSDDERARFLKLYDVMKGDVERITQGKRAPTDDELKGSFDRATIKMTERGEGWFSSDREVMRFEARPGTRVAVQVPDTVRARILDSYRRVNGRDPTEVEIGRTYMDNLGRKGFW